MTTICKWVLKCAIPLFVFLLSYNSSYAQKLNINVKNTSLESVLKIINKQSGYRFSYTDAINASTTMVTVNIKEANPVDFFKTFFKEHNINYLINNKLVSLSPAKATTNKAQGRLTISGRITDDAGAPLAGVAVTNDKTKSYTASDLDGNYSIAAGGGDKLSFSLIGMETFTTVVGKSAVINVPMRTDVIALNDVVVTGYQTLSRDRVTGAFGSVTSDKLNTTMTSDVISKIDGKVAGLKVTNGNIIIRGAGTLLSSTDPLIVVDGFPIENGLESVNPDDIQNITVLKDAAAASIWGTRAGNGVIVITTKQGKKNNKPTIDVSYQFTVSNKNHISDLHLLSASDAVDLDLELIQKSFWSPRIVGWHFSVGKLHEYYYDALTATNFKATFDDIMKDEDFSKKMDQLRKAQAHKQIEKYIFQNPMQHRANISLSGGSERSDYYVSGVFESNKGNSIRNINNDFKLNLKYSYYITDKLTFNTNASIFYSLSEQNSADNYSLTDSYSYHNLVDENGKRIQYYMIDPWEGKKRESMGYLPYTTNLLDVIDENDNKSNNFTARLQASLNYKIIDGLNINTKFQYERGFLKNETSQRVSHPDMRAIINAYTTVMDDGQLQYNFPLGGLYEVVNQSSEAWTWRNQIDYNKDFGDKHQLLVLFGHELRKYKTTSNSTNQYGYDFQSQTYIPINEALLRSNEYLTWLDSPRYTFSAQNTYGETDNRDFSLYANAGYTFNKKYSLSLSGRMDQSNIFGNDSKYKYNIIWSGGLSWKLSDEKFMKCDWLDNLVIRATYGLGGNINKSFFPVLMGQKYVSYYTGLSYLSLTNPENKNLKWETSKTTNIGVDFSFLNGRIDGGIDLYNKRGDDLLGRVSLDPTNGFKSATMNFASVNNRGVEINLSTMPIKTNKFSWVIGGNITYNKNKVIKVDDAGGSDTDLLRQIPDGIAVEGKPINRLYAYRYAGLDSNGEPMLYEKGEKISWADYSRNVDDLEDMGTTVAPWYGGLNTSFKYKNFTLSAMATFEFGHVFRKPTNSPYNESRGMTTEIADRWRTPGDENSTNVPALTDLYTYGESSEFYLFSNLNVLSADYIKLNELSLSYNFKKSLLPNFINNLNLSVQVRNLYQWNKNKENINPQSITSSRSGSTSYYFYDPTTFIFSLKLTL